MVKAFFECCSAFAPDLLFFPWHFTHYFEPALSIFASMHRYYRFGHPKLKPPKDPQTEEEYIAAMEKQEAADAVDREKVEAEEHTRALM